MRRFRRAVRFDKLETEPRSSTGRVGRVIYLGLLGVFVCLLSYYFLGGMFVLSADGVVLSERQIVAARYPGMITAVLFHEGDTVTKGESLVQIKSFETVKTLADLSLRNSEFSYRDIELRAKAASIEQLLPLANETARQTRRAAVELSKATDKGLVPMRVKGEALNSSLDAAQKVAELSAQLKASRAELVMIAKSQKQATAAIARLDAMYDQGVIRATTSGIVGPRIAAVGQVVSRGDELLETRGGKKFVLAYLPESYLFPVRGGTKVSVRSGNQYAVGVIEKVMQIAGALPEDFQSGIGPRNRSRMSRIVFEHDPPFALMQKVAISGCAFGRCWLD